MNSKFRNIFLVFGVVAVVIMLFTFDVSYDDLLNNLRRAGFYLGFITLAVYLLDKYPFVVYHSPEWRKNLSVGFYAVV